MEAVGATPLFFIGGPAVSTRFSMVSAGRCERAASSPSTPTRRAWVSFGNARGRRIAGRACRDIWRQQENQVVLELVSESILKLANAIEVQSGTLY